jgi:hypothetical protein
MKDAKGHGSEPRNGAHQDGVNAATSGESRIAQFAKQIMDVYHSQGQQAAMVLRDKIINDNKMKTFEYSVLVDHMRRLR